MVLDAHNPIVTLVRQAACTIVECTLACSPAATTCRSVVGAIRDSLKRRRIT